MSLVNGVSIPNQLEVRRTPATLTLESEVLATFSLGILAVDALIEPTINGHRVAARLPTDACLLLHPDGTATFAYSDLFSRHFRTRPQNLRSTEDAQRLEDLLALPEDFPRPKFLLDIHDLNVTELYFNDSEDILWWTGDLIYKFDLGLPIKVFRLTNREGYLKTTVGDWDWPVGRAVTISASNDGRQWTVIWRSSGEGGKTEIDEEIPSELLGQSCLYLKFHGQDNNVLFDLHLSADLDATELIPLTRLEAGKRSYEFMDHPDSSHHAILFWEGPGVYGQKTNDAHLKYPSSHPEVHESPEAITIRFPQQVGATFQRKPGQGLKGIGELTIGQRRILADPHSLTLSSLSLQVISNGEVGGVTDWAAYLQARANREGRWPRLGGRDISLIDLSEAEYLGYSLASGAVIVHTQLEKGEHRGQVDWIVTPFHTKLGETHYRGIGWKVRVKGIEQAIALHIAEPVVMHYGDWLFAQTWGQFIESRFDFASPLAIPRSWYFGDTQPFFFTGGPGGGTVSFFERPIGARAAVTGGAGRAFNALEIPLGKGTVRETPMKYWLWTDRPLTRWAALDEWTSVYDALADNFRRELGLSVTEPKPTLWWQRPGEAYLVKVIEQEDPSPGKSWLDTFAKTTLEQAAELGFRVIYIEGAWDNDALHPPRRYLPGSECFGSVDAPWRLEISETVGGERALKALCDRAHALGIAILLWSTPAHLSNSSPLLREHPEWIKWRHDGTPETFDYTDITGTSLNGDYYDYALAQYRKIQETTGFDGFWSDSFLTFGMLPDYREDQPQPQLDRSLAMQAAVRKMGCGEIHIEGCGPCGVSTGGYGYELVALDEPDAIEAIQAFERIRGREYGLYRYVADTFVEPESYYRTLASKGAIGVFDLNVLTQLSEDQRRRIQQANRDTMRVLDKMERRQLVVEADRWMGVAWTRRGSDEIVLFAFERFRYPSDKATVEDITSETTMEIEDGFLTESMHTYLIQPSTA